MKRIKISDIAKIAHVSTSTVDRVLNKRPGVRRETVDKVDRALSELGYNKNRLSELIQGRPLNLIALLPKSDSSFMKKVAFHLDRAGHERGDEGVSIGLRHVDLCDVDGFVTTLHQIRDEKPDGVILVPIDTAEAREAIDDLIGAGIPVVTLISDVPQSKRAYFVGIDNLSAGRTAGNLMARFLPLKEQDKATIGVIMGFHDRRDHQERRAGLEQALAATRPGFRVIPSHATCDSASEAYDAVRDMFETFPNLAGIYNVGCGNAGVARALKDAGRDDLVVIGHELTDQNRKNLVSGRYDAVVAQDYWVEADHAVKALASICRGDKSHSRLPHISIDIFIKDNLP